MKYTLTSLQQISYTYEILPTTVTLYITLTLSLHSVTIFPQFFYKLSQFLRTVSNLPRSPSRIVRCQAHNFRTPEFWFVRIYSVPKVSVS